MVKPLNIFFILILVVFLAAPQIYAATVAEASTGHERPSVGKYDLSGLTEDEREWFFTFLNGNFFADGWKEISAEILMNTVAHEREQQQIRLYELGYKIGREWCKRNETRKIHTAMLRKWGSVLKETADDAPHLLGQVIQRIDREVSELLD